MRGIALMALAGLPLINALSTSSDGRCGPGIERSCSGTRFGACCSQYGWWSVIFPLLS